MKKQFLAFALLAFSMFLVTSSCSKNGGSVTVKSNTELLTQGTWKFQSASASGTDVTSQISACQRDNILTFSANGNGNVNEGPTKCNAGDPDNTPFTWSWLSNETQLRVSTILFTGGSSDFTLNKLTESELTISQYITRPAGPSILISITFTH